MGKKGVEAIIEEIEIFINNSKHQTLSQTKVVVVKSELLDMLEELKMKLPSEIERCKKIMRNKEQILSDARTRSNAIITESVNEANRLVDQHQITELANIRANEILEMARSQAQQIVDQASDEATEIRLGAMYYTKDKLTEMRDTVAKIHAMEKENYRSLIESLENDNYIFETNISEMETNINMITASSNMSYATEDDDLDSAFSTDMPLSSTEPEVAAAGIDDEIDVYGERGAETDDSEDDYDDYDGDDDDFLDE